MVTLLSESPWLWGAIVLAYGLLIGSFLNVVILRLPRRMEYDWRQQCAELDPALADGSGDQGELALQPPPDLVFGRSKCPSCGHQIRAWENIPLISFLVLRGRCSGCASRISIQYPLVEATTGVLSVVVALHFGVTWLTLMALILTWGLVALSVIDLREQLLPDILTLPLLWLGLLVNASGGGLIDPVSAIIGAVAGYLVLWLVYHAFRLLTGKEGMGYGDFKLLAMFGAWLGWQSLPLVILLSSLVGAVVGIGLVLFAGKDRNIPIPFGPYIAAAGWIALLWGDHIIATYLRVSGLG